VSVRADLAAALKKPKARAAFDALAYTLLLLSMHISARSPQLM
jgi:hypothetical protein